MNGIRSWFNRYYKKGVLTRAERKERVARIFRNFMGTPKLPNFVQEVDWPYCCGDFTVFIGDAGKSHRGPYGEFKWWGYEDECPVDDGVKGMLGSEDRVSLFRCPRCSSKYWTYQGT